MTVDGFLASLHGRADAIEQLEGALAAERIDPHRSREDVARFAMARAELLRERDSKRRRTA